MSCAWSGGCLCMHFIGMPRRPQLLLLGTRRQSMSAFEIPRYIRIASSAQDLSISCHHLSFWGFRNIGMQSRGFHCIVKIPMAAFVTKIAPCSTQMFRHMICDRTEGASFPSARLAHSHTFVWDIFCQQCTCSIDEAELSTAGCCRRSPRTDGSRFEAHLDRNCPQP